LTSTDCDPFASNEMFAGISKKTGVSSALTIFHVFSTH
jgi:hypothetical protein